jgi:NhaP-type Na+/H+ or K+/H+ antiporter
LNYFPHHDVSFDEEWFLRILVPPIIFEAALSIDKRAFNRHIIPIVMFSVIGTVFATLLTASIVHYTTVALGPTLCPSIPMIEAMTFGSLISSIDPIAVLSVLSSMGITDTETIYVLIFGESLLNDGVAIVLFHTLVHFLDENLVIDTEAIITGTVQFFAVATGSLTFGIVAGSLSTIYFWLFHGCQTALIEVIMFFCWAMLPYYVCDGIGWSGIVAAVAVGFVMDIYILGEGPGKHSRQIGTKDTVDRPSDEHIYERIPITDKRRKLTTFQRNVFSTEGHLSLEARKHIGFVLEIISTSMETAIFAYLGFFMFSYRYHWNVYLVVIAIIACLVSRAIMVPTMSYLSNWLVRIQHNKHSICAFCFEPSVGRALRPRNKEDMTSSPSSIHIDTKMKIALWFAGLRGAMSFALVEHVPMYDSLSGHGTRLKPELKAMTSASIMFTVFLLGGSTYYIMRHLGIDPSSDLLNDKGQFDLPNSTMTKTPFTRKQTLSTSEVDDDSDDYDDAGDDKSETGIGLIQL